MQEHLPRKLFKIPTLLLYTCLVACEHSGIADNQGNRIKPKDYKGQWLVVNYWAAWCKPCIEEIPELNKLLNSRDDVSLFAVNYDGIAGNALTSQIRDFGIEYPSLLTDPSENWGYQRPSVLPTTIIFNPKGKLHSVVAGPQTFDSLHALTSYNNQYP